MPHFDIFVTTTPAPTPGTLESQATTWTLLWSGHASLAAVHHIAQQALSPEGSHTDSDQVWTRALLFRGAGTLGRLVATLTTPLEASHA